MKSSCQLLSDGSITLRALEPIDVDTLYKWENDTTLWSAGVTLAPFSRKQLWDYVNNYDGDIFAAKQLRLMIDIPGDEFPVTIGTIDLYDFDAANSRCAIGILIASNYHKQGYASAAIRLVENYCRTRLSLHQLYCIVAENNIASRKLFEKSGFKISGRLKSWIRMATAYTDAYMYQKFL
ncbi:MAG: GNAT family N-acetyltransferase [Duncaniella sp.]|nr:GNAT family N-acetyltransferase [Duncaniella sp.]